MREDHLLPAASLPAHIHSCLSPASSLIVPASSKVVHMLLPSPLPSEPFLPHAQSQRPALKSIGAYQHQPQPHTTSATNTLLASCRALQNILSTTPLSCQTKPSQLLPSRAARPQPTRAPLQPRTQSSCVQSPTQLKRSSQHNPKKRRRNEYECDSCDGLPIPSPDLGQENPNSAPSTPKRRRRIPLSMPLGLCPADFHSLRTPHAVANVQLDMPIPPAHTDAPPSSSLPTSTSWTAADDSALVSTVLEKLQLSRHEWNDCARILGKDKDSLGRRWRMLVGDGEVGLRRGQGRRGRVGLDLGSW